MDSKIRLLLIEDNLHDARFFYEYIRNNYSDEFELYHCKSFKSGIEYLTHNQFDIIVTDLTLPDSSGLNTFLEIKKISKNIPVIINSGIDDKDLALEAVRQGAQDYINKGQYEGESIYRILLFAIERKKLMSELETSKILLQRRTEQLQELNDNLLELNRNKDTFYSIVSHDLLNPFNTLNAFSNLLVESYINLSEEEKMEMILKINDHSDKIFTLIKNLLQWTALSTGRIEFKPESININKILNELIEFHKLSAKNKNIEISYFNEAELIIKTDKFMIETVFRNLLTNAIKFTKPGGKIIIRALSINGSAVIEFEDNGIGMNERELKNLFGFGISHSKEGTQQEAGTGLGLILCKDFIIKNNGNLEVKSEPNKGTTFIITFPIV